VRECTAAVALLFAGSGVEAAFEFSFAAAEHEGVAAAAAAAAAGDLCVGGDAVAATSGRNPVSVSAVAERIQVVVVGVDRSGNAVRV